MCFYHKWAYFMSVLYRRKNRRITNCMNHRNFLSMGSFPYGARYSIKRIGMNNIRFEPITDFFKIFHTIRITVAPQFLCHFFECTNTIFLITIFIEIKLPGCAAINCNAIDFFDCLLSLLPIGTVNGHSVAMPQKIFCK